MSSPEQGTGMCLDVYIQEGGWAAVWDCTLPAGHGGDRHAHGTGIYWPTKLVTSR